mmetsp:Transcript_32097/g.55378  ORF Transcript_32097/g.55378 Transcript_32097/m.55378 type:complete len:271 (-) Transcript_32097:73-885(-)
MGKSKAYERHYSYNKLTYRLHWLDLNTKQATTFKRKHYWIRDICIWLELPGHKLALVGGKHTARGDDFDIIDVLKDCAIIKMPPLLISKRKCGLAYFENYLYIIGGYNGISCAECERFSFDKQEWSNITSLPVPLRGMGIASLPGFRKLYALGGEPSAYVSDEYDRLVGLVYELSFDSLIWITLSVKFPLSDYFHIACFVTESDTIYYVNEKKLYRFDPAALGISYVKDVGEEMHNYYGQCYYKDGVIYCANTRGPSYQHTIGSLDAAPV